ncbi:MAG: hypothetical protein HN368_11245 [Spirochaetales bacterium]|jgi:hypothetical protein|nr:hypothetical protein [Spirochaetales bacterium]
MLHDPSHKPEIINENEIDLAQGEKDILKNLGERITEISADPVNKTRAELWRNLNDLESKRPMVWINEIPWHEMNFEDELTLQTVHPWARALEDRLRKVIYQWKHLPGDMVVNDYIDCPAVIHSTDFGILEDVDIAITDSESDVVSRHYNIQITSMDDLEKIQMPRLTHLEKVTNSHLSAMTDIFEGIIPVKKVGQTHIWFTPWDFLIRWWGVQEAMMDLVMRPEMVNAFVDRLVDAWMAELDQFSEMNLLSLDNNNTRVGSGGYGYVSELPGDNFDPNNIKPENMWGCSNAQIFSEVSPDMHWEFALEHDLRWLERWGLTYYGCCEPLHNKIDLLKRVPNLRKISVSPWCDTEKIIKEIGTDYVMSRKPSPAVFAVTNWDPDQAEKEIGDFLETTDGEGHVELIMKDISTVNHKPERLWEWETIASRLAEEYSK